MKRFKVLPILLMLLSFSTFSIALDSARDIDRNSNGALSQFYYEVKGSEAYLNNAKAYLVFPDINEAGFFFGGKYGEGVLRVGHKTKAYYSITSLSAGFQAGIKNYALVIVFTSERALNKFLLDDNWETDIDVNIAMAEWNSDEELDDIDFGSDMIGFIFDSTGMMGNFSFEGTKFERINPNGSNSPAY